jgi:uncharacterized repeat protein (TIGR03803 family)
MIYNFPASSKNGSPYSGLIWDSYGNLYGTTFGATTCGEPGYTEGSVFKIDSSGAETVVHGFSGADGACPFGELIRDGQGNLYGTTFAGGTNNAGVVFKMDPAGVETVLHNFTGAGESADGCAPQASPVPDKAGNLYGTTRYCGTFGVGTVFKIDPNGNETVLHNFNGGDGGSPMGLISDVYGNLYGIASSELYELSKDGIFTVLHTFVGGSNDGCDPLGTPIRDKEGNFYGTALCGSSNFGVVWKFSKDGKETVLHTFTGGASDGAYPSDHGLIFDAEGNLYGVTLSGGAGDFGTVYRVAKDGTFTLLHAFTANEGQSPFGRLNRDRNGDLYGTTQGGGSGGVGTVWRLTP